MFQPLRGGVSPSYNLSLFIVSSAMLLSTYSDHIGESHDPRGGDHQGALTGFQLVGRSLRRSLIRAIRVIRVKNAFQWSFSRSDGNPSPGTSAGLCLRGSSEQRERAANIWSLPFHHNLIIFHKIFNLAQLTFSGFYHLIIGAQVGFHVVEGG